MAKKVITKSEEPLKRGQVVKEVKKFGSPFLAFDSSDLMGVLKNALMIGGAAVLTYVVQNLSQIEMGESTLIFLPIITMVLNTAIKWLQDSTVSEVVIDDEETEGA